MLRCFLIIISTTVPIFLYGCSIKGFSYDYSYVEIKRGKVKIPGFATIDTRVPGSYPPTKFSSSLNVWDSVEKNNVVGVVYHNAQVYITGVEWVSEEKSYYFKIMAIWKAPEAIGWISAEYINPEAEIITTRWPWPRKLPNEPGD